MKSIAIVGAGIGGCSAAYFASQNIPNVKLTIFEALDRVGGRILTHKTKGLNIELGASFINETNRTIFGLANSARLKLRRVEDQKEFAVWNGSEIVFESNGKLTNLNLLMRYRLSIIRAFLLLREVRGQTERLYLEEKEPIDVGELLESSGLGKWTRTTFEEILLGKGMSRTFVEKIATPLTRTIYTQNADLGGLAGISSLLGSYGGAIFRLADGNDALPSHLANASQATIKLKQKVVSVEKTREGSYRVSTETDVSLFDGLIIATPIELSEIELDGVTKPVGESQEYQKVYTKIMKGLLRPQYFGLGNSMKPPTTVLTTKEADPITHIGIQRTLEKQCLVTVSSPKSISDDFFDGMFEKGGTPILEQGWTAAYPKFRPMKKLPLSQIDERLVYLNSIEAAVSSMETAALSALNATRIMKAELS